jgi:hypothetical protein
MTKSTVLSLPLQLEFLESSIIFVGMCSINLFTIVTYNIVDKARSFVTVIVYQGNLTEGKAQYSRPPCTN